MSDREPPTLLMLAGPNGAGKSTFYEAKIKPHVSAPFINADLIQRDELKNPSMETAYQAAQIAETRRQEHLGKKKSFVSESTFSHPSKLTLINEAKEAGFRIEIYYVNVSSPDLCVERVTHRVAQGGHDVPEEKIRERYERNQSLIREAVLRADRAFIYDNSTVGSPPKRALFFKNGMIDRAAENLPTWCQTLYAKEIRHFRTSHQAANPVSDSFDKAKAKAEKLGLKLSKPSPNKTYSGEIVATSNLHLVQKTGADTAVIHYKKSLIRRLKAGDTCEIAYKIGSYPKVTETKRIKEGAAVEVIGQKPIDAQRL